MLKKKFLKGILAAAGLIALSLARPNAAVYADTEEDEDLNYSGYYEDDFAKDGVLDISSSGDYQSTLRASLAEEAQAWFMSEDTKILPSLVAAEAMYISQNGNSELAAKYNNYYNIPFFTEDSDGNQVKIRLALYNAGASVLEDYTDVDAWSIDNNGTWYQATGRWCTFDSISDCIGAWYKYLTLKDKKGVYYSGHTLSRAAFEKLENYDSGRKKGTNNQSADTIMKNGLSRAKTEVAEFTSGDEYTEMVFIIENYALWTYDIEVLLATKAMDNADDYVEDAKTAADNAENQEDVAIEEYKRAANDFGLATGTIGDGSIPTSATALGYVQDAEAAAVAARAAATSAKAYYDAAVAARDAIYNLTLEEWLKDGGAADYYAYDRENTLAYVIGRLEKDNDSAVVQCTRAKDAWDNAEGYAGYAEDVAKKARTYYNCLVIVEKAEALADELDTISDEMGNSSSGGILTTALTHRNASLQNLNVAYNMVENALSYIEAHNPTAINFMVNSTKGLDISKNMSYVENYLAAVKKDYDTAISDSYNPAKSDYDELDALAMTSDYGTLTVFINLKTRLYLAKKAGKTAFDHISGNCDTINSYATDITGHVHYTTLTEIVETDEGSMEYWESVLAAAQELYDAYMSSRTTSN